MALRCVPVNRQVTGTPVSLFESTFAPPNHPAAGARAPIPSLIEGVVPLPSVLLLRNRSALDALHAGEGLSAREITRLTGASRSGTLKALDRFGIARNGDKPLRVGHLPFGFDYLNHQLVENDAEQAAINMMQQDRVGGRSLREIVGKLNQAFVPTKQDGVWQANTVREILARA